MTAGKAYQPLRSSREFRLVYDRGVRLHSPFFSLFILETAGQQVRLGITVTKKVGPAVVRNRCKRRLREIARRSTLPHLADIGCDIVINAKTAMIRAQLNDLVAALSHTLSKYRESFNRAGGRNTNGPSSDSASTDL
jgi:ribonuclease P protein component